MNIRLGEAGPAYWALSVPVGCSIVDAFLAEDVGTSLENHLSFPLCPATTHYLGFVLFHLHF